MLNFLCAQVLVNVGLIVWYEASGGNGPQRDIVAKFFSIAIGLLVGAVAYSLFPGLPGIGRWFVGLVTGAAMTFLFIFYAWPWLKEVVAEEWGKIP